MPAIIIQSQSIIEFHESIIFSQHYVMFGFINTTDWPVFSAHQPTHVYTKKQLTVQVLPLEMYLDIITFQLVRTAEAYAY